MPCPLIFESNCKNRDDKCSICFAVIGEGKLYYMPLSNIIKEPHPCKNLAASARGKESNKRGRKIEASIVKDLGLEATEKSGAKFRDGDGNLYLPNGDFIPTSIKSRTTVNKLAVTAKEWRSDELHIIHSKEYGKVFIMSELVFEQLENGYTRQKTVQAEVLS